MIHLIYEYSDIWIIYISLAITDGMVSTHRQISLFHFLKSLFDTENMPYLSIYIYMCVCVCIYLTTYLHMNLLIHYYLVYTTLDYVIDKQCLKEIIWTPHTRD